MFGERGSPLCIGVSVMPFFWMYVAIVSFGAEPFSSGGAVDVFTSLGETDVDSGDGATDEVVSLATRAARLKWLMASTTATTATIARNTPAPVITGIQLPRLLGGGRFSVG